MVSTGRFRNGSFQRNHIPQSSRPPSPRVGSGSTGSLLDEYDRAEWAQNQAEALEWGLQQEQITPGWLEPIGGTGLYVSPNEPVDPTDCDRYPNSPYCGGSGVDPFALASLSPVGADITFTANRDATEVCLRLDPSLFAVSLPPLDVCYRTPNARPLEQPQPPTGSAPATPDDLPPQYFPFDFDYPQGACAYIVKVERQSPNSDSTTRIMGRPTGGYWVWTINGGRRWRVAVPGIAENGQPFGTSIDYFVRYPAFPDAFPESFLSFHPLILGAAPRSLLPGSRPFHNPLTSRCLAVTLLKLKR